MGDKRIKLGVIGCGRIAQAHLGAYLNLRDDAELISVADIDGERAKETSTGSHVKKYHLDYREMLRDPEVEAVIIALPHYLHHPVTIDAAKASKHVLVEKPMALNVEEADGMVAAAEENKITLMVAQSRRFPDAAGYVFEHRKDIGEIFRARASFMLNVSQAFADWWTSSSKAGGLVTSLLGSHAIDYVLWVMEDKPSWVCASSFSRKDMWEGEDEVDILMHFDKRKVATVHLSMSTFPEFTEYLFIGEKGSIRLHEFDTGKPFGHAYKVELSGNTILEEEQDPPEFTAQLREFLSAIREGRVPLSSGREVRDVMHVIDAVMMSARDNSLVRI
jgi:predicted dehydrogenase